MLFADIDECYEGLDLCDSHADCNNTIGSYECTCTVGYTGNGITCGQYPVSYISDCVHVKVIT